MLAVQCGGTTTLGDPINSDSSLSSILPVVVTGGAAPLSSYTHESFSCLFGLALLL